MSAKRPNRRERQESWARMEQLARERTARCENGTATLVDLADELSLGSCRDQSEILSAARYAERNEGYFFIEHGDTFTLKLKSKPNRRREPITEEPDWATGG